MKIQSIGQKRLGAIALALVTAAAAATSCGPSEPGEEPLGQQWEAATTPVTVSFQNGVAPTAAYTGGDDATIKQGSASTNFGSATSCEVDGDDGSGVDKSCLVRWTLSGIPAGSVVQSATITLRVTDASSNTYSLYSVLRSWTESQTTWNLATSISAWATAGALGASDRGPTVGNVTGSSAGSHTITLNASGISLVQNWVNGGTNAGIIVASATNTDGIDFASNESSTASDRPRLTITYLPPDSGGSGGAGGTSGAGGGGGAGSSGAGAGGTATISTDPNLKVAFIGDTSTGANFSNVLNLVKNEGAAALVVQGDMSYSANPPGWWNTLESVLGTTFPVFIARGNHDDGSWSGYLPTANNHLGGATRVIGAHNANYKTTFRGLVIATIARGDNASNITPFFQGDQHIWRICSWHENQQAMQVGSKANEMGWEVYETCRQLGAIIETGHEHSYSRTRTLSSTSSQTIAPGCTGANSLCVGPGRTFVNVVGLGGNSVRSQTRCLPASPPYGCNGLWGSIYASNQGATYGAQFITFNVGGAPKQATGYFKNVNGVVVDTFSITHD
jgi:hypothetical protein